MSVSDIPFRTCLPQAEFALQALRAGAQLARRVQQERVIRSLPKADHSPVTVADYAVQAVIGRMLAERFPADRLIAEEDSQTLRRGPAHMSRVVARYVGGLMPGTGEAQVCDWIDFGRGDAQGTYWVLDPVDGTKGFLRNDHYVVALALISAGEVILGGLGCPRLHRPGRPPDGEGSVVLAARGEGSWISGLAGGGWQQLHVSKEARPEKARLLRSFEPGHTDEGTMDRLARWLESEAPPVRMDSQAKYARLALGEGELLFRLLSPIRPDYREKIWDQAAGSIVVEEAGGKVTDLRGYPLDFSQGRELTANIGVLASNGRLHQVGLRALEQLGAQRRP